MMIELELECLMSRQWQEQIRDFSGRSRFADFSRASRAGAAKKIHWVKVYTGISGYIGPHSLHIE
jgi:hypothetical protein